MTQNLPCDRRSRVLSEMSYWLLNLDLSWKSMCLSLSCEMIVYEIFIAGIFFYKNIKLSKIKYYRFHMTQNLPYDRRSRVLSEMSYWLVNFDLSCKSMCLSLSCEMIVYEIFIAGIFFYKNIKLSKIKYYRFHMTQNLPYDRRSRVLSEMSYWLVNFDLSCKSMCLLLSCEMIVYEIFIAGIFFYKNIKLSKIKYYRFHMTQNLPYDRRSRVLSEMSYWLVNFDLSCKSMCLSLSCEMIVYEIFIAGIFFYKNIKLSKIKYYRFHMTQNLPYDRRSRVLSEMSYWLLIFDFVKACVSRFLVKWSSVRFHCRNIFFINRGFYPLWDSNPQRLN